MEYKTRTDFLASIDADDYTNKVYNEMQEEMMFRIFSYIKEQYLQLKQNLIPLRDHIIRINLHDVYYDAKHITEQCEAKCNRILGPQQAYDYVLKNLTELGYLVYRCNEYCAVSLNQTSDLAINKYCNLCNTYISIRDYNATIKQKRKWYHKYLGMYIESSIDPEIINYYIMIGSAKWTVEDRWTRSYTKVTL